MSKINKLTSEQKAEIPIWYNRYFDIGSSCEPINKVEFSKAISAFYARINKKAPVFIYCESPLTSMLMIKAVLPMVLKDSSLRSSLKSSLGSSLWSSLWSSLRSSLKSSLESSLDSSLWSSLRSSLWSSLRSSLDSSLGSSLDSSLDVSLWSSLKSSLESSLDSSLRSSLESSLDSSLRSSLDSSLRSSLDSSLRSSLDSSLWSSLKLSLDSSLESSLESSLDSSLRSSLDSSLRSSLWSLLDSSLWSSRFYDIYYLYGSINSYWISFYKFCEHIGVMFEPQALSDLNGWQTIAEHGFNWWPKDGICVCSDRPEKITWNAGKVLHANGEMAVKFRDGWGMYANDGILIPEKYGSIKTSAWRSDWLLEEKNSELRMCLIKNIGYDKLCQELEAKKLDAWREYELIKIDKADVEPIVLLKMICPSTGKIHASRMPPSCTKAREAATMLNAGFDPETFIIEH